MLPKTRTRTSSRAVAAFLFDLIQDVSVLRPLVRTISHKRHVDIVFLVSRQFEGRDKQWMWRAELDELAQECGATVTRFESPFGAVQNLSERHGIIFSASESNLAAHAVNHQVFLSAPPSFVRITVQHGYECVGFNQNREQTAAHGKSVRFAADILCGWVPREKLRHLSPSEADKYFELGPPMLLNRLFDKTLAGQIKDTGLICENLHSVRMRTVADLQSIYLSTLLKFATAQVSKNCKVAVRTHPGGQFVVKNRIELPQNVVLSRKPMYKTDLSRFKFGISAPSSVLIDMVLADLPTAVWQDEDAILDISAYAGLQVVSSLEEWLAFAESASTHPGVYLEKQQVFLRNTGLDVQPELIAKRFLSLVDGVLGRWVAPPLSDSGMRRVLLVANGIIPTLHISFLTPLEKLENDGSLRLFTLTEKDIIAAAADARDTGMSAAEFAVARIEAIRPDIAVFCRYSGPEVEQMVSRLRSAKVPVIFHIDDDLLNVPKEIGDKKFLEHSRTERTSTIRFLIDHADLVYCSTVRLRERFKEMGIRRDLTAGSLYASGEVVAPAELRAVRTIGFMGNDKTPELVALAPVIAKALNRHPYLRFELFGSMAMPEELKKFGSRVSASPPVSDYEEFVQHFTALQWDIGLCPLHKTPFNLVKADTKWVDYSSIGAAVIASRSTAYDAACADGCGILVDSEEEWSAAIDELVLDPEKRFRQVQTAQAKLREFYSVDRLIEQVLSIFDAATSATGKPPSEVREYESVS